MNEPLKIVLSYLLWLPPSDGEHHFPVALLKKAGQHGGQRSELPLLLGDSDHSES